jgi:hypothetical protein
MSVTAGRRPGKPWRPGAANLEERRLFMKTEEGASRRDFLKLAGTAAPAAAVVVATAGQEAQAAEPDLTSDRMQDTAHTRAYFASAKF